MSDLMLVINLLIAFALGGAIGWVREKEGKYAGLRTHILVCVGGALLMMLGNEIMQLTAVADPSKLAAGIITGIGFLGAGCIVQSRGSVTGITTAASIWVTTAIGLACGLSLYLAAITTTIITIVTLELLGRLEKKIIKTKDGE